MEKIRNLNLELAQWIQAQKQASTHTANQEINNPYQTEKNESREESHNSIHVQVNSVKYESHRGKK